MTEPSRDKIRNANPCKKKQYDLTGLTRQIDHDSKKKPKNNHWQTKDNKRFDRNAQPKTDAFEGQRDERISKHDDQNHSQEEKGHFFQQHRITFF